MSPYLCCLFALASAESTRHSNGEKRLFSSDFVLLTFMLPQMEPALFDFLALVAIVAHAKLPGSSIYSDQTARSCRWVFGDTDTKAFVRHLLATKKVKDYRDWMGRWMRIMLLVECV